MKSSDPLINPLSQAATIMKSSNPLISHYIKTVCLDDWWLIKSENEVEGKRIAVAGVMTGQRGVRVFSSSPIIKTYDLLTLETADGICILLRGFINRLHTCENGFSSEVFNKFLFGFPPDWEEHAEKCLGRECTSAIDPKGSSGIESCYNINKGLRGMGTSTPIIVPSSLPEETPSKITKLISEDIRISEDILHETNVTLEDNGARKSAKKDNKIHLVACKKASIDTPKDCISSNIPAKKIAEAFKTPKLKRKSSVQKDSNAKGSGIYGTARKLKLDIHGSPLNQGENKTSSTSPGSMSLKRSRSGRLLVPPFDFWRNQKAVYDKNGQLVAIQDGSSVVEFSRGLSLSKL